MTPAVSDLRGRGSRARTLRRRVGIGFAAAVVGVGLLHLPLAKGFLMRLGGCPFAGAALTPAQMDTARHIGLATRKGATQAPARPALGFTLDATSEADVHHWAERVNAHCEDSRAAFIVCTDVSPAAVGRKADEGSIDELALGFNQHGKLVNITTMRGHMSPVQASSVSSSIASSLRESLGPATRSAGAWTPASLAAPGAFGMATVSYRYSDYVAELAAMNIASSGVSVREHYVSAND